MLNFLDANRKMKLTRDVFDMCMSFPSIDEWLRQRPLLTLSVGIFDR